MVRRRVWLSLNSSLEVFDLQAVDAAGYSGPVICATCHSFRGISLNGKVGGRNAADEFNVDVVTPRYGDSQLLDPSRVSIVHMILMDNYALDVDDMPELYTVLDFVDAHVVLEGIRFWIGAASSGGAFNSMIAAYGERTSLELTNCSLDLAGFTFDSRLLRVEEHATARLLRVYFDGTFWMGHEFFPFPGPAPNGRLPLLDLVNAGEVVVADSTFIAFGTSIRMRTGGWRRLTAGDDDLANADDVQP